MKLVYYPVAEIDSIEPGTARRVSVGSHGDYLLHKLTDATFHITGVLCPHQNEPLDCGWLDGHEIVCRRHQLRFDIASGRCTNASGYWLQQLPVKLAPPLVLAAYWEDDDAATSN